MKNKLSKKDLRILRRIQAKKNFGHPIYRVDVLEYARIVYANKVGGLCTAIATSARILCGIIVHPNIVAPKFDRHYAEKYGFTEDYRKLYAYWWPIRVWAKHGRLGFLNWLIEEYKNDKTIMPKTAKEVLDMLWKQ